MEEGGGGRVVPEDLVMTSAVKIFTLNTLRRAMSSCSGGKEEDEEDEEERCPSFPPSFLSDVFPLPQSSFLFF